MTRGGVLALGMVLLAAAVPQSTPGSGDAANSPQAIDFRRDVQPILEDRCWKCHGEKKQKAGLRLDTRQGALLGADFGSEPVILPGDPEGSRLLQVVRTQDEDERMPPMGKALSGEQIELLERWIEQGALWPDNDEEESLFVEHWAYRAPVPEPPPTPRAMGWVRNEIDRFVLSRLEQEGLDPSPEASREVLLRRLCLDLTGLPPTLEQIETFLADESETAYESLVERLLASPHYGERQARAWLDLARYADTNGYEKDQRRSIWRFRDWVIEAYNRDMGFDQFTLEQLAGDLVQNPTRDQRIATGFHRNTMINAEGGVDPEEFRVAAVIDRVNTTASVWLGTTLACAQCHTHKYDPFSHRDYYRLFAYFNSSADVGPGDGPRMDAPTPELERRESEALEELAELERVLARWTPELEAELESTLHRAHGQEKRWSQIIPGQYTSSDDTTLARLNDGAVLAVGQDPVQGTYEFHFELPPGPPLQRLRIEVLPHPTLPGGASALSSHGNFVLSEVHLDRLPREPGGNVEPVGLARAAADYHQGGNPPWPPEGTIDGDPGTGWAIAGGIGQAHHLVLDLEAPLERPGVTVLRMRLDQNYGGAHMLGHLRFSASTDSGEGESPLEGDVSRALRELEGPPQVDDPTLRAWYLRTTPLLEQQRARKRELEGRAPLPTTLVMEELAEPRATHILERGSFLSPGKAVSPGVPAVLPQPTPNSPPNRLGLARWLTSPGNPLTARVTVNRLWEQVFGRGLVTTTEDFGTRGESPSHPALLDWLALQFERDGWSTKQMLRRIVLSSTYRQSSRVSDALRERDPHNRLLARGARYRVEAEMVRDIALTASGLLDPRIGGPSVFPPQPDGVWNVVFNADQWVNDKDGDRFRRGLYTFWRRTSPYPSFMAFDAPSRELTCIQRAPSNTPLQALALLNDPVYVEAAVALAARLLRGEASSDRGRIELGFQLCTGRRPTAEETDVLLELLTEERQHYQENEDAAGQLIASEAELPIDGLDPQELAAWTLIGNVLLNLDETITRS